MRALIVDDSTVFRRGLSDFLTEETPLQIIGAAADGWEALRLARSKRPDLILMDLHMPACNGLEATRYIKAEMPEVHILLLTASGVEAVKAEAVHCGAEDCVEKDADQILTALERLAGSQAVTV